MSKLNKLKKIITALILAVALLISGQVFLPANLLYAKAESEVDITTSSVRDDLESMDMDNLSYLSNTEYIFITMSQYYDNNNNLRSYLYLNICGTVSLENKVLLSTSVSDSDYNIIENYKLYDLVKINNDSTWYKFEIKGLENLEETTRRYNIKSVGFLTGETDSSYYAFITNIDQTFIYNGITNNSIQVFHQEIETITITDKEVYFYCYGKESGFLDFFGGDDVVQRGNTYMDCWYVFFNTDKPIDELLEVEITFQKYYYSFEQLWSIYMSDEVTIDFLEDLKSRTESSLYEQTEYSFFNQERITITPGTTKVSGGESKWFGKYETFYREIDNIMDLRTYSSNDDSGNPFCFEKQKEKYTWGVNFLNTEKNVSGGSASFAGTPLLTYIVKGYGVSNTAILRLRFRTDGVVKNCYAVDKPTDEFFGESATEPDSVNVLKKILALVFLILFFVFLGPFLSPILSVVLQFLGKILRFLIRFIWKILTFPFRLFRRSRIRKRKR